MKKEKKFKSRPAKIKSFNESLNKKLDSLLRTLNESGNSSLSAPRAGLNKRIILLKISEKETVELINPEIVKGKDKESKDVYEAVAIKYQNRDGSEQAALLTDAEAVRFNYEFEYLNGLKDEEECGHSYEIVHGFQDSYEQCVKCRLVRQ